jgi:hypothetical protein
MTARPSFADIANQFTAGNPAPYESIAEINRKTEQMRAFRREIEALPPMVIRVSPKELKHAIIDCDPLSHVDLVEVLMNLAAKVKAGKGSALGDKCAAIVADALTEIMDVVDQDRVVQEKESDWALQTR